MIKLIYKYQKQLILSTVFQFFLTQNKLMFNKCTQFERIYKTLKVITFGKSSNNQQ